MEKLKKSDCHSTPELSSAVLESFASPVASFHLRIFFYTPYVPFLSKNVPHLLDVS